MHSITLLAMLLALFTTVFAQSHKSMSPWTCSSMDDAPLDARQLKHYRNIFSDFLVSRDMTENGPLRTFMSTTFPIIGFAAATKITDDHELDALANMVSQALETMDDMVSKHAVSLPKTDANPLHSKGCAYIGNKFMTAKYLQMIRSTRTCERTLL